MSDEKDNVVTFPGNEPKDKVFDCGHKVNEDGYVVDSDGSPLIFVCGHCDCRSFRLLSNGVIECCNCDTPLHTVNADKAETQWRKVAETAPSDKTNVPEINGDNVNVRAMGDEDFSMRLTLKDLDKWRQDGTLMFVGAYRDDGHGVWWVGARDSKTRNWIVDKIEVITENLKASALPDEDQPELDLKSKND